MGPVGLFARHVLVPYFALRRYVPGRRLTVYLPVLVVRVVPTIGPL